MLLRNFSRPYPHIPRSPLRLPSGLGPMEQWVKLKRSELYPISLVLCCWSVTTLQSRPGNTYVIPHTTACNLNPFVSPVGFRDHGREPARQTLSEAPTRIPAADHGTKSSRQGGSRHGVFFSHWALAGGWEKSPYVKLIVTGLRNLEKNRTI